MSSEAVRQRSMMVWYGIEMIMRGKKGRQISLRKVLGSGRPAGWQTGYPIQKESILEDAKKAYTISRFTQIHIHSYRHNRQAGRQK